MRPKKCEYCRGKGGGRTHRSWWEPCAYCYTTGHAWRWLVKLHLFYWRHFKPAVYPQFEYDQFNPVLYPPYPWTCRGCNGVGCDVYAFECEACHGSGLRWPWFAPIRRGWRWLITPPKKMARKKVENKSLGEDEIPF